MNYLSLGRPKLVQKVLSILAILALIVGTFASLISASEVYANNGLTVTANPSTGTLHAGDSLEVQFHDPSGTTDAVADTCLVNGVETASTFANVSPGLYHVTYTVGANDQSQAAGQVPINCTLHQQNSITITAFDDANTVAIDTSAATSTGSTGGTTGGSTGGTGTTTSSGGSTGGSTGGTTSITSNGTAAQNGGLDVSAVPSTGTLHAGATLEVQFHDPSGTTDAVADTCLVNNVEASSTFANVSPGLYHVTYTVGANDQSRAAGNIPIDCTLHQQNSVHVVTFTDSNTVAIDTSSTSTGGGTTGGSTGGSTGGTGTTTGTVPTLASVSISPNVGTSTAGDLIHAYFQESHNIADLAVAGDCKINAVDVSGSFANMGSGLYGISYTVGANDGERPSGHVPIRCFLGDSNGTVFAGSWTDHNTLSIDTNGDGFIDNGTSTLGFTITATPSTGTLHAGDQLKVSMQDPLPSGDVVVGQPEGCTVNGVNVANTYTYDGNGLYHVTYTVGANDQSQTAGNIPFNCRLQNATGSVHLTFFTDGNTVAVDTSTSTGSMGGTTGGTGGSTGGTGTTTSSGGTTGGTTGGSTSTTTGSFITAVGIVPGSGSIHAGSRADIYFSAANNDQNVALDGACRINGVDVSNSFQNLTDGLYKVVYTVGSTDSERAAGHIPLSCAFRSGTGSTTVATAFTDGNTLAIDTNNDGVITEPTGNTVAFMSTVTATPSTGTLHAGDQLHVTMHEGNNDASFSAGVCTVNNVDVANTFANLGGGSYQVAYTVGASDASRGAGQIPVDCTLHNTSGETIGTFFGFTDSNTVAIDTSVSTSTGGTSGTGTTTSSGGDTGGTGTTTSSGGNTGGNTGGTGTTTGSTTGGSTSVTPIVIASVTADPTNGTIHQGAHILGYIQEANNASDLSIAGSCAINGVTIHNLENLNSGRYRLDYTIGLNDTDRLAGQVPIHCVLGNSSGATTTISAWTDNNQVAIDANDDGIIGENTGGSFGGDVTGGSDAVLAVSAIDPVSTTATAGGGFDHGWVWLIHVTVPSNETHLSVKFSDWTHINGTTHLSAGGNMRISSPQADTSTPVDITAADTYSAPLTLTGDMDPNTPGRQVEIRVEMQVPESTLNGSYTTNYGIRSSQ